MATRSRPYAVLRDKRFNAPMALGRNDPCHCGSGEKYKRCHLDAAREGLRVSALPPTEAVPTVEPTDAERRDLQRHAHELWRASRALAGDVRKEWAYPWN